MNHYIWGLPTRNPEAPLFIDGDHRYEGVRRDFELYQRLVTAGGIIAFHDILPRIAFPDYGVHRFWAEVKPGYRHEELIEDPNQGMMGIGLLIKD
ncbi:MAG: class I SAM-dependent methyltransferase [Acidobacteria bacterium]|nr:class I SAM-dependent methyltransferase [Acidobacteriota bacterium]